MLNGVCTRQVKPDTDILQHFTRRKGYLAKCCIKEMGLKLLLEVFDVFGALLMLFLRVFQCMAAIYEKPLSVIVFCLLKGV